MHLTNRVLHKTICVPLCCLFFILLKYSHSFFLQENVCRAAQKRSNQVSLPFSERKNDDVSEQKNPERAMVCIFFRTGKKESQKKKFFEITVFDIIIFL